MQELLEELFVRFEQTWSAGREQNAQLTQALSRASAAAELPNQLWYLSQLRNLDLDCFAPSTFTLNTQLATTRAEHSVETTHSTTVSH